ncbi:helix-hairpin-helix domain-containing protein [Candidatus Enterococcus murrayae]|uniref:Helix-hairpin-helix domain-containing protein n=1 Tax=Candidatus Enterococcus murrayae TaxID=2815321 RepID=A0ABS3HHI8_9ENTE|nr:helix-hairpin-helix domain-containing protein [Enterococcus sp. MJM16]MBO0452723.1 helix-hairpin-helix domain-containing protein [Enterococcus sp. MJM16]
MKAYLKKYPYLIVLPIVLAIVGFFFLTREPEEQEMDPVLFSTTNITKETNESSSNQDWYVDVKGEVKRAGMYRITQGMRLMDAIDLAGGFTEEADQNQVNFSKLLTDQEIIYVPKNGEEIPTINENFQQVAGTTDSDSKKININTADANELQELSGIGEKKAADIIKYREENGSFHSVEELTEVSGIGEKTLENLKDSITI